MNRLYLLPKLSSEMYFLFYAYIFEDLWNLNILNTKIVFSQEQKELSKSNKKDFSKFRKCSLLKTN